MCKRVRGNTVFNRKHCGGNARWKEESGSTCSDLWLYLPSAGREAGEGSRFVLTPLDKKSVCAC